MQANNATIHKTKALKEELNKKNIKIIYSFGVSYCPQYNLIEYIFNTLKSYLKKEYVCNYKQLQYKIKIFIENINFEGINNYIKRHIKTNLK